MRQLGVCVATTAVFNFRRSCTTMKPQMWSESDIICGLFNGIIVLSAGTWSSWLLSAMIKQETLQICHVSTQPFLALRMQARIRRMFCIFMVFRLHHCCASLSFSSPGIIMNMVILLVQIQKNGWSRTLLEFYLPWSLNALLLFLASPTNFCMSLTTAHAERGICCISPWLTMLSALPRWWWLKEVSVVWIFCTTHLLIFDNRIW